MLTYKKENNITENKLEELICSEPSLIEDGLKLVQRQYRTKDAGVLDALMIDKDNSLVVLECKINNENYVIYQTMDYVLYCQQNISDIAETFAKYKIDVNKPVRAIVIAPEYLPLVLRRVALANCKIDLYTYQYIKIAKGETLIYEKINHSTSVKNTEKSTSKIKQSITGIDELFKSLSDEDKKLAEEIHQYIISFADVNIQFGNDLLKYKTGNKARLYLVCKGKKGVRIDLYDPETLTWSYKQLKSDKHDEIKRAIKFNIENDVTELLKESKKNSEEMTTGENIFDDVEELIA